MFTRWLADLTMLYTLCQTKVPLQDDSLKNKKIKIFYTIITMRQNCNKLSLGFSSLNYALTFTLCLNLTAKSACFPKYYTCIDSILKTLQIAWLERFENTLKTNRKTQLTLTTHLSC